MRTCTRGSVPVVTLISDLNSSRTAYLGLENDAAGRTAGYLIGRFIGQRAAKVALSAGSRSYLAYITQSPQATLANAVRIFVSQVIFRENLP